MPHREDTPTPDNGFYVVVTGANRFVCPIVRLRDAQLTRL